jgi:hypothetical protein
MKSHIPRRAVSTAEAGLFLASLLVTASVTGAQNAGESCGTAYVDGTPQTWIPIPFSQLSATKGDSIIGGKDGCATSGTGVHAHVSAEMPYGTYLISAIAFRGTAGKATTGLTIMAGTANSSMLVQMISSGVNLDLEFTRCRTYPNYLTDSGRQIVQCNQQAYLSGSFVVFQAEELTVCDVLVCGAQKLFSEMGTPLTAAAALMMSEEQPDSHNSSYGALGGRRGAIQPAFHCSGAGALVVHGAFARWGGRGSAFLCVPFRMMACCCK